jgi:hypothetical protein
MTKRTWQAKAKGYAQFCATMDFHRAVKRQQAIDKLFAEFEHGVLPPGTVIDGEERVELRRIMEGAYDKVICSLGTGRTERRR